MRAAAVVRVVPAACVALAFGGLAASAQDAANDRAPFFHVLSEAGDVSTPAKAQAAMDALARNLIAQGGGVIVVTNDVAESFRPENTYQTERKDGPTVTILDIRKGYLTVLSSQIGFDRRAKWSGVHFKRTLNMKGESLPHWGSTAATAVENNIVSGSSSFMKRILFPARAGADARIYPTSIDGLWPGASMNLHGPRHEFIRIKSLGWDPEERLQYCTADLEHDHPEGAMLQNKHNTNAMIVHSHSNADNQTFWLDSRVYQYGVGDSFAVSATHRYQGNVFSGLGDEGAVCFNAEVVHDLDPFYAEVESFDPETGALVYGPGTVNAHKLSMSRPLVDLNREKWITQGHVLIVRPDDYAGFVRRPDGTYTNWTGDFKVEPKIRYKGKPYPSLLEKGPGGAIVNVLGGLIEGSAEAPWDESVVGRYFAADEPSERINPGDKGHGGYRPAPKDRPVRRWYRITDFAPNPDGTKSIRILRVRWASVSAGSPILFRQENYTRDGHVRPLKYIIAPGGLVYDISKGWTDTRTRRPGNHYVTQRSDPRTLMIAPNDDRGTRFDFEPGDRVVQAVGPDPYIPRPIRIRMYDQFPGTLDNPAIQVFNNGHVTREAGISFAGGPKTLEKMRRRKDGQPSYTNGVLFSSTVGAGIRFSTQVRDAAMLMEQPGGNAQPIVWKHSAGVRQTSICARPADGNLAIVGGALDLGDSGLVRAPGISGTATPARNLRGVDVPVKAWRSEARVTFDEPEADAAYALYVQPSWFAMARVVEKRADGFSVAFSLAPTEETTFDWMLVR